MELVDAERQLVMLNRSFLHSKNLSFANFKHLWRCAGMTNYLFSLASQQNVESAIPSLCQAGLVLLAAPTDSVSLRMWNIGITFGIYIICSTVRSTCGTSSGIRISRDDFQTLATVHSQLKSLGSLAVECIFALEALVFSGNFVISSLVLETVHLAPIDRESICSWSETALDSIAWINIVHELRTQGWSAGVQEDTFTVSSEASRSEDQERSFPEESATAWRADSDRDSPVRASTDSNRRGEYVQRAEEYESTYPKEVMSLTALHALEELEHIVQNVSEPKLVNFEADATKRQSIARKIDRQPRTNRAATLERPSIGTRKATRIPEGTLPKTPIFDNSTSRKRKTSEIELVRDGVSALEALERMVAEYS